MLLPQCLLLICLLNYSSGQRRPFRPQPQPPQPQRPPPQSFGPSINSNNDEANSQVLSQISDISPDGSYYSKYETSNGITFEEQGQPKSVGQNEVAEQVQGSASWTDNTGQRISITWLADENGAVFQGDHLPTPPPSPEIPPLIQRALDWIAANPTNLSQDSEGQYREEGDDAGPRPPVRPPQQSLLQRRPPPKRF